MARIVCALFFFFFAAAASARPPRCATWLDARSTPGIPADRWGAFRDTLAETRLIVSHGFLGETNFAPFKFALVGPLANDPQWRSRVDNVNPSSFRGFEDNVQRFASRFRKLVEQHPPGTSFVIVAFSYSGPIWTRVFARWPELLTSLRALYPVQSPFGGSVLADHVLRGHPRLRDADVERWLKWYLPGAWATIRSVVGPTRAALVDLSTSRMQRHTRRTLRIGRDAGVFDALSRRVFYVLGHCAPEENVPFAIPDHLFQQAVYGPSDGVVLLNHQYPSYDFLPRWTVEGESALGTPHCLVAGASHQTLTDIDRRWSPFPAEGVREEVLSAILTHAGSVETLPRESEELRQAAGE